MVHHNVSLNGTIPFYALILADSFRALTAPPRRKAGSAARAFIGL
jgi:hypothetical protein